MTVHKTTIPIVIVITIVVVITIVIAITIAIAIMMGNDFHCHFPKHNLFSIYKLGEKKKRKKMEGKNGRKKSGKKMEGKNGFIC